ncbi:MAG: lyase family protein [Pseudomonadales bacterium]|nr:lyase family protein [Pseudomonadales bacterium]
MSRSWLLILVCCIPVCSGQSVESIFSTQYEIQTVLRIEGALAAAQGDLAIIPKQAANEISASASTMPFSNLELQSEKAIVQHRMVALLNVWGRTLSPMAREYIHYGATTVDIYDTTLILQLLAASDVLDKQMCQLEQTLISLSSAHKNTIMVGRTLGQHALPITFGKKMSTWLGENARHRQRLGQISARLRRSAILKGAVGSYLGLGPKAISLEKLFSQKLGLDTPYASDWHANRDLIAEYALFLALVSKTWGHLGSELFLLQSTDIGETLEFRSATSIGSSTMPHKVNPSKSEALIQASRSIPRLAEVVLDDMVNIFERDNTSRPNKVLADISIASSKQLAIAHRLLKKLIVRPQMMLNNLNRTGQLIMAQRLTFALAKKLGKTTANDKIRHIARTALAQNIDLRTAFLNSGLSEQLTPLQLDELLDPTTYLGQAVEQVEAVIAEVRAVEATNCK